MRGTAVSLFVAVVLVAAASGVGAAQPSISVTVSSEDVQQSAGDGETVVVPGDATLQIDVSGDQPVESLFVRLDGTTVASVSPNATSVSESVALDLDDGFSTGEHSVTVIAEGESTSQVSFTLIKDDERPFVSYQSPVQTDQEPLPDSITVSSSLVTFSGELHDISGVSSVDIESEYQYRYANENRVYTDTAQVTDPGGSFSADIYLGNGENDVTVTVIDDIGNRRVHETVLTVDDTTSPSIDLSVPDRTEQTPVELTGTVQEQVQLESVVLENPTGGETSLLSGVPPRPDPERRSVEIDYDLSLQEGQNTFAVEATDLSGNVAREEFTVTYERNVAPVIEIDREATTVTDGEITIRGLVSDGEIASVVVETIAGDDVIDISQVYSGDEITNEVQLQETLSVESETPTFRVRATDSEGTEHVETYTIGEEPTPTDTPDDETATETASSDDAEPTATETPDDAAQEQTATPTDAAAAGQDDESTGGTGALGLGTLLSGVLGLAALGRVASAVFDSRH